MLPDAPVLRGLLVALRLLAALIFAGVAIGLLTDVRVEEVDLDCGFAPVAAVSHDTDVCRVEGRNQSFGAAGAAAMALALWLAPRLDRRSKGSDAYGPGDSAPGSAMDTDAWTEIRSYRRRASAVVGAALAATVIFTIVAVDADRDEPLTTSQRHAVLIAIDASGTRARIAFEAKGAKHERDVLVDGSRQLAVGDGVTIELDGADAGSVRVLDEEPEGPWWPVLGWLGSLAVLAAGAVLLRRSRRTYAILSAHSWRRLRQAEPDSVERWVDSGGPQVIQALETAPWRLRPLGETDTIDVAGPRTGMVVVRVPMQRSLILARSSRPS